MSSLFKTAASSSARKISSPESPRSGSTRPTIEHVLKLCPVCRCRRIFRVITQDDGTRKWRDRKNHVWMSSYHGTPAMLDDKGRVYE